MTKTIKIASLTAAALIGASLLSGCQDTTARELAQQALDAAKGAQACCDTNTERMNAMYQKTMRK